MTMRDESRDPIPRWSCDDCGVASLDPDLLSGPHPFASLAEDPGVMDVIYGCPKCGGVSLIRACDVRGCVETAQKGVPRPDGSYVSLCSYHHPEDVPYFAGRGITRSDPGSTDQ